MLFRLDPSPRGRRFRTGRLVGWNLGRGTLYALPGDARHGEWRTPERALAAALLGQVRAASGESPWMRFSGLQIDGALGEDGYHFEDPRANMAPYQWLALAADAQAAPVATLNFGSGTAAEAARYAAHLASLHAAGSPPVQRFEIGNETYGFWNTGFAPRGSHSYANPDAKHGGDPAWHGRPARDPATFAARALEYVRAVRAQVPDARFWVPLSQASMDAWGDGVAAALDAFGPLLDHEAVDALVIHHYAIDDGNVLAPGDPAAPELAIAGFERFRARYVELARALASRAPRVGIAVTEYHVAGAFARGAFPHGDRALVGLGVADVLLGLADVGVAHACQHLSLGFEARATDDMLVEPWYLPLRPESPGTSMVKAPSYVATQLVAEHLLHWTVSLEARDVPRALHRLPSSELEYPLVTGVAFADDAGREASVVFLNRDLERGHRLTLELPEGSHVAAVRAWAPPAWDADGVARELAAGPLEHEPRGTGLGLLLPPHSVTGLRLRLRG